MRYLITFMLCLVGLISPAFGQQASSCQSSSDAQPPTITYEYQDDSSLADILNPQILDYLNTAGPTGLESALAAAADENQPLLTAQVIEADFTGDVVYDVLVHITVSYGAGFDQQLWLYTCEESDYTLRAATGGGGWGGGTDEVPARIIFAADINNNSIRDIAVRKTTIEGQKDHETLKIYEWDGKDLATIFSLGPRYGSFRDVAIQNMDDDPATLELQIGYFYAYEEEVAMAFVEFNYVRPITMLYAWDGTTFAFVCQHFADNPTNRLAVLHSAETYRACGDYDVAQTYYEQLWRDRDVEPWTDVWHSAPWLEYPEDVEDQMAYAAELEGDYLRAFAAYRLIQLHNIKGQSWSIDNLLSQLRKDYPRGTHGYLYAAMARAFSRDYETSGNLESACAAAETAFNDVKASNDDPAIDYYEETIGDTVYHYGYYFYSGYRYGSDPDNLFAVPEDIDSMISIPICL